MKQLALLVAVCLCLTACGAPAAPAESTPPTTASTTVTTTAAVTTTEATTTTTTSATTTTTTTTTTTATTTTTTTAKPTTTTTAKPTTTTTSTKPTTTTTTAPTRPTLAEVTFTVEDPHNSRGLPAERNGFGFGYAKDGVAHDITVNNQARFDGFDVNALAWDNKTEEKVLYLTFDCGYAYEDLVPRILNTLKEKQVSSAFFCTMQYLKSDGDMVQRMIDEGHIVGNHTATHPSDCSALTRGELAEEIRRVHNYLRTEFGYNSRYFRFPTGAYSHNALDLVCSVGYRSVFWSIAHRDWDPDDQPGVEVSFQTVTERLHPGAVILLHSTSPDNVAMLGRFIDYARQNGYTFRSLDEYAYWK